MARLAPLKETKPNCHTGPEVPGQKPKPKGPEAPKGRRQFEVSAKNSLEPKWLRSSFKKAFKGLNKALASQLASERAAI